MTMQGKEPSVSRARPAKAGDVAKAVFAAGGLLAAFGVASCCALPVALSLLGVSAASLVAIGYLATPYQQELFTSPQLFSVSPPSSSFANDEARRARPVRAATITYWMGAAGLPCSWRLVYSS